MSVGALAALVVLWWLLSPLSLIAWAGRLFRLIIAVVVICIAAGYADAGEEYIFRDNAGRRLGTIEKESYSDELVIRNKTGHRLGTIERNAAGELVIRDKDGGRIGTLDRGGPGSVDLFKQRRLLLD